MGTSLFSTGTVVNRGSDRQIADIAPALTRRVRACCSGQKQPLRIHNTRESDIILSLGFLGVIAYLPTGRDITEANIIRRTRQTIRAVQICNGFKAG